MPFKEPEARRANGRARYARQRPAMLAAAAERRADPEYRERARLYASAWRDANPDRRKGLDLRRHGLSLGQYRAMDDAQDGVCAICARPESRRHQSGRIVQLSVDHDHATGRVRGLLCRECNIALGWFGDDPFRVLAAFDYLKRSLLP